MSVAVATKFADQFESHGLTYALMVACGSWAVSGLVAFAYYRVYPREYERFREKMQQRRELIGQAHRQVDHLD